jgi:predicted RNA binding protein YcfA (HicA-like mRNA interferase family)
MKVKDLIKLLEDNGWTYDRQSGSHRIFTKPGARRPIPVAGKLSDDLPKGTLNKILREAGLK